MIVFLIVGSLITLAAGLVAMVLERTGVNKPDADTLTHSQSPSDHAPGTGHRSP